MARKRKPKSGVVPVDLDAIQDHPIPPQRRFDDWCDLQDQQWDRAMEDLDCETQ